MDSKKYNRTFHLPWSRGATSDDKIATTIDSVLNTEIVITEKMDGSNTSLEANGCFSRSHSGAPTHPSFDGLKALHASIKYKIPEDFQFFGEWCFAKHSILYSELPAYFMLFNVRELRHNLSKSSLIWNSWDDVELWAEELEVPTVPVLFRGTVKTESSLQELTESFMKNPSKCGGIIEGVVVRVASSFDDNQFSNSVLKMVRANHVTTSEHWAHSEIIRNMIKSSSNY